MDFKECSCRKAGGPVRFRLIPDLMHLSHILCRILSLAGKGPSCFKITIHLLFKVYYIFKESHFSSTWMSCAKLVEYDRVAEAPN